MSGVRKRSPLARGRNHGLELSLMFVLQVNSGTAAEVKEVSNLRYTAGPFNVERSVGTPHLLPC